MPRFALLCLLSLIAARVHADSVSNVCVSGTCDIANPIYVNVFWDDSEDKWNRDIAAMDAGATVARINATVQAIIKSDYFKPLKFYSVASARLAPPIVEGGCGSPAATIADNISFGAGHYVSPIAAFATCLMSHHPELDPSRTVLNVFFPPQIPGGSGWCAGGARGSHNMYSLLPVVETAVLPAACHKNMGALVAVLTHEMVEAATDPSPGSISGWKTHILGGQEIGDLCEGDSGHTTAFLCGGDRTSKVIPCAAVNSYWSNPDNACTNGMTPPVIPMPVIDKAEVCGTGKNMRITLTGNLDTTPWDLGPSGHGGDQTLFLQVFVKGKQPWSAGGIANAPPDSVGLGSITWTPAPTSATKNLVTIQGFDDRYGLTTPNVMPGDRLTVSLWSPSNGQPAHKEIVAPSPTNIAHLSGGPSGSTPADWVLIDQPTSISGMLADRGGCAVASVSVTASASASDGNFPDGPTITPGSDGMFGISYLPTGVAGPRTVRITSPVSASVKVEAHPLAVQVDGLRGSTAGGQTLTLHGDGFGGTTKVTVQSGSASAAATHVRVHDKKTLELTTPPSPLSGHGAGNVEVVVNVNGLDGAPLPYEYITPGLPMLTFAPNDCVVSGNTGLQLNQLTVDMYQADGSESASQVALKASYPAFVVAATGARAQTLTVNAGATVGLWGVGPITATSSADSKQTVTQTFKQGTLVTCLPNLHYYAVAYNDAGAPVESKILQAIVATDGVGWGEKQASALVFTSKDKSAVTAAAGGEVRAAGTRELRSVVAVALLSGKAGQRVVMFGSGLSLRAKKATDTKVFASPATLVFRLPAKTDGSRVRIVHAAAGGTWTEIKSSVTQQNGESVATAGVQDAGTYATVRVEN